MHQLESVAQAPVALDLRLVAQVRDGVASELSLIRRNEAVGEELTEADEEARAHSIIWEQLDLVARSRSVSGFRPLTTRVEEAIARRVHADLFGLGGFEDYVNDPSVENIFVNGCDRVFVNRAGGVVEPVAPVAESDEAVIELINRWASRLGRTERRFDVANPRLDLRLPGGHRLHAIMEVTERPTVTIRCPYHRKVELDDQVRMGTIDEPMAAVLRAAVKARCNIIVAGGTGTGKTTMLRAMLHAVPPTERIITIEDTIELALSRWPECHPNVVEMETRQANVEGVGELTMMELTRECLRMSPDRVVLGEVRGAEALYMLKAMSQGNDGSMCTLHADSAYGVADRIRGYVSEGTSGLPMSVIDGFFRNAVDLIVHLRVLSDRRRVDMPAACKYRVMGASRGLLASEAARFDEVCRFGLDRLEPLALTIARAFAEDPIWQWLYASPGPVPVDAGVVLARALVADTSPADETHGLRHHGAVALWRAPADPVDDQRWASYKADRAAPHFADFAAQLAERMDIIGEFSAALHAARPAEPHWYLSILATDPDRQNQGLGSQLLTPMLARSDRTGVPLYLESSNPRNHGFYQRHGFVEGDEIAAAGSPPVLAFYRTPDPTRLL